MTERILRNARLVTRDETFTGHVVVRDDRLVAVERGDPLGPAGDDLDGDFLLPGLVELHTDNLEKHVMPRPGVMWDARAATVAHDAQCATAGITTVLDSVMIGSRELGGARLEMQRTAFEALDACRAAGVLRVEHRLHLRCEVATPDVVDIFRSHLHHPLLALVSVMDHTPGQRQWRDLDKYRQYQERNGRMSDERFVAMLDGQQHEHEAYAGRHRRVVIDAARGRGLPVASHDDTEVEHVREAQAEGITMSEFPTTLAAARAARQAGMGIIMGGPNLVRGGSHSGNVSATELAREDLLDIVSSDYVPSSLLQSAFLLHDRIGWTLPRAVASISATPAQAIGLADRGRIAPGLRADLIRVRLAAGAPVVLQTWFAGRRVA